MSKDIKKALEHCIEWDCVDCPNREELGSGETVCRGRLLIDVLGYVADLEAKLAESESKRKSLEEKIKFLTEETEENFVDGQKYNQLKYQHVEKEDGLDKTIKFNTSNLDGSEFD